MTQQEMKELQKANAARWETLPPVHPAALIFPMMSDTEIDEMAANIKKSGLRESSVFWEDNHEAKNGAQGPFPLFLLDGRNRVESLRRLGDADNIKPDQRVSEKSVPTVRVVRAIRQETSLTLGGGAGLSKGKWVVDVDPWEYVMSANAHRRHLTPEQKREAIAKFIKERPQVSNRKIAKTLGVSDHTVADVREETVPNSQTANVEHLPIERARAAARENPKASVSDIEKAASVSRGTAQRALKTAHVTPAPKPKPEEAEFTMSQREKIERAIKREKERLAKEFEEIVRERVVKLNREYLEARGPEWQKEQNFAQAIIRKRHGIMKRGTFNLIVKCLHPDKIDQLINLIRDDRSEDIERLKTHHSDAFRMFNQLEKLVLNEKDSPTNLAPSVPKTEAEWDARRAAVRKANSDAAKARVAAKKTADQGGIERK